MTRTDKTEEEEKINKQKERNVYKLFVIGVLFILGRAFVDVIAEKVAERYYAEDIAAREYLLKQSIIGIRIIDNNNPLADNLKFTWAGYNTRNWTMKKSSTGSNNFESDYEAKSIAFYYHRAFMKNGWGEFKDNTPPNQTGTNIWKQKYKSKQGEFLTAEVNFDDSISEPMSFSDNYVIQKRTDGKKTKYYLRINYYDKRDWRPQGKLPDLPAD